MVVTAQILAQRRVNDGISFRLVSALNLDFSVTQSKANSKFDPNRYTA